MVSAVPVDKLRGFDHGWPGWTRRRARSYGDVAQDRVLPDSVDEIALGLVEVLNLIHLGKRDAGDVRPPPTVCRDARDHLHGLTDVLRPIGECQDVQTLLRVSAFPLGTE